MSSMLNVENNRKNDIESKGNEYLTTNKLSVGPKKLTVSELKKAKRLSRDGRSRLLSDSSTDEVGSIIIIRVSQ